MESLKLSGGQIYELVANGVQENGDEINFVFIPDSSKTFEQVEAEFTSESNIEKIYVLDSANEVMRSIVGYTQYKGMKKEPDYSVGTDEDGNEKAVTVLIVTMSKPDLQQKYADLQSAVDMLILDQLGA